MWKTYERTIRTFIILGVTLLAIATEVFAGSGTINRAEQRVPNEYIITFEDAVTPQEAAATRHSIARQHGRVITSYDTVIKGLLVHMSEAAATALSSNRIVRSVEENALVTIAAYAAQTTPNLGPTVADLWGLDRLDQLTPSAARLNGRYEYCSTGAGVRAYVVDTGVFPQHKEFQGRVDTAAGSALTAYLNSSSMSLGQQCWQDGGFDAAASHGTSVASLIGGRTYGAAKGVTLVDARALNCAGGGDIGRIVKVLDWIPQDPNRYLPDGVTLRARVVNLSFAISKYAQPTNAINAAIQSLTQNHNITVVAAAGNFNANGFWYTPANSVYAIVAAGLNKASDTRWQYSNFGYTTDIYAPAQYVESASTVVTELFSSLPSDFRRSELGDCVSSYGQDTCTSGTSFAAPLTAGVVARYLERNRTASPNQVLAFLQSESASHAGITVTVDGRADAPVLAIRDCP